jgi:hypothetical protein
MGRRSPVLGYNHNVRYRGLVFHVQTEDSGIVNPHLFTHLFHGGVIVSTRKLVYDPDADDGVVKSLMQAQHKAVMKELRRGLFDDKIDQNLSGTPGLLPSGDDGTAPNVRPSAADLRALDAIVDPGSQPVVQIVPELTSGPVAQPKELTVEEEPSEPEISVTIHPNMTPPGVPITEILGDGTQPTPPPHGAGPFPPPHDGVSPSRTPTPAGKRATTPPPMSSASLPPIPSRAVPGRAPSPPARPQQSMTPPQVVTRPVTRESPPERKSEITGAFESITSQAQPPPQEDSQEIEIHSPAPGSAGALPGADRGGSEYNVRRGERGMRDEVNTGRMKQQPEPPRPAVVGRRTSAQPAVPAPPAKPATSTAPTADANAAKRPGSGPQTPIAAEPAPRTQPPRPPPGNDVRIQPRGQPPPTPPARTAPPVAPPPPPAAAAKPSTAAVATAPTQPQIEPPRTTSPSGRARTPTAPRPFAAGPAGAPKPGTPATGSPVQRQRTGSGPGSGGVVMSRPAVIVGGRSQTPTPGPGSIPPAVTSPSPSAAAVGAAAGGGAGPEPPRTTTGGSRVRRAREDVGGRGVFGQDLISEKSLDEVILAYLSEDASEE